MKNINLPQKQSFEKTIFQKNTHLFVLRNTNGAYLALTDYGARVVSILIPDKYGNLTDVALGYNNIDSYLNSAEPYFGATIGRYANRIANGQFELNGKKYILTKNNNSNSLHGGPEGFHHKVWDRRLSFQRNTIDFYLFSPDGEEGFPGDLRVHVNYTLTDDNEIIITYRAQANKDTILNLTNHTYFNLNGEGKESILNHKLKINSPSYLPINNNMIPLGAKEFVHNTAFDFRKYKAIGKDIGSSDEQLKIANGYDHTYINTLNISSAIAEVFSSKSGILMEVFTSEPGVQLYTGNFLESKENGKSGTPYDQYSGFCLETQHYPDSPNQVNFPSTILKKDEEFHSKTIYKFSLKRD